MSDKYSSEFKAKVALDAVSQSKSVIEELAKKYDVSEEEIISWAAQLQSDAAKVFGTAAASHHEEPEGEDVSIETEDEEFAVAVDHGVMSDNLNIRKLTFWSLLGIGLVIVFVIGLIYFAEYSLFESQQRVSTASTYTNITEMNESQEQELNSFGVVDLENGIYRIPIDSAINRIAEN